MKIKVKVEGLREIKDALRQLPNATAKGVLRKVGRKRLKPVADRARDYAPKDQGELKDSIEVSSRQKSGRQTRRTSESKSDVNVYVGPTSKGYPQAMMQEIGTKFHPPHPYLRPAWDAEKHGVLEGIKDDLWAEIKKAVVRLARRAAKGK
jgi:HK97 gp10 family phage protein